jgi:hypothetical protein
MGGLRVEGETVRGERGASAQRDLHEDAGRPKALGVGGLPSEPGGREVLVKVTNR